MERPLLLRLAEVRVWRDLRKLFEVVVCPALDAHGRFLRPAFGSRQNCTCHVGESTVCCWIASGHHTAHEVTAVSRAQMGPRASPSTASSVTTGTAPSACVEKVSHSLCASVSSLASKYWRSITVNLPKSSCWIPQVSARQSSVLGRDGSDGGPWAAASFAWCSGTTSGPSSHLS